MTLERQGRLDAVITQNIDGLHAMAGTRERRRGARQHRHVVVPGVRRALPARDRAGPPGGARPTASRACDCGAPLKPDVVLFGEFLPEEALSRPCALADGRRRAAVRRLVARGAPGGAGCPAPPSRPADAVAIVTRSATPYDGAATVRLSGDVVAELEGVLACL